MDPKLAATINVFRDRLAARSYTRLSEQQEATSREVPVISPVGVARVELPLPSDNNNLCEAVWAIIQKLSRPGEVLDKPTLAPVRGEWVGIRQGVGKKEPEPCIPEEQKYAELAKSASNKTTVLYVHGGTFIFGSPVTARPVTGNLAKLTEGKLFSLKYRLSPQNTFPAALMDLLLAYIYLLHPPKGAWHEPVDPCNLVLAADSVGGDLILGLMQLIQHFRESHPLRLDGKPLDLPTPAGISAIGLMTDQTHAFPAYLNNGATDVYKPVHPCLEDGFPTDSIWPSNPPRSDPYCDASALCHPLISPSVIKSWPFLPPVWLAYGTERLLDDGRLFAQQTADSGVTVQFSEYEQLPHIFPMLFPGIPHTAHLFGSWARFIQACVSQPQRLKSYNKKFAVDGRDLEGTDQEKFSALDFEEMMKLMEGKRKERMSFVWTGGQTKGNL